MNVDMSIAAEDVVSETGVLVEFTSVIKSTERVVAINKISPNFTPFN